MLSVIFDMETGDPDDVMTLCVLATHPRVDLRAVTVFPGGRDQVGIVKHVLNLLGRSGVPVGAGTPKKNAPHVSGFHYKWLGHIDPADADGPAAEVMVKALKYEASTLLTGAALTNVHQAFKLDRTAFVQKWWTCQGGFAGDNVVPPEHRLPKFTGRITCPTYNLGGDRTAAETLINCGLFSQIRFVSKNVCHGIIYDRTMHDRIPWDAHPGLDLLKQGMETYFKDHSDGKALHDVIAAALAINPQAAKWSEGELFYKKGEWGFNPSEDWFAQSAPSPHHITVALDIPKFEKTLTGQ